MSAGTAATAKEAAKADDSPHVKGSVLEVPGVSTRLGLTSFGGPVAHRRYFREKEGLLIDARRFSKEM